MITVGDLLKTKGNEVYAIAPDRSVYEALELLAEKNVGVLLVLDQGELVGILSERDYARKVILHGKASENTPVRDIMTSKVICVHSKQLIEDCMLLMTDEHIRHLPVLEGENVVGVISMRDIVKEIISDQQFMIDQLERYIRGS